METISPSNTVRKRPDFLTVLCILTFIGSGMGFVRSVANYANADIVSEFAKGAIDESREKVSEEAKTESGKALVDKLLSGVSAMMDPAKLKKNYLLEALSNLITLIGGILMFRLRKIGFWSYVAGIALLVFTPMIIFGPGNLLSMGMTLGYGIAGILFIVLYSLNLKHMS